jgi:hypothetical protein
MSQGCPTGNGEIRGPEAAQGAGTPLPGSRPDRARANDARNADFLGQTPVADQGGFGTEDMIRPANYLGTESVRPTDICGCPPPDLAAMGDGGEAFGGT